MKSFKSMCHQHLPTASGISKDFQIDERVQYFVSFPSGPTSHWRRHVCRTWAALLWVGKVAGSIGHEGLEEFLGLQDGADPMEMALLDDIFGRETQVCLVSQIILKKTTGAYEHFASPSHLVCSGAYARDMGVWSLVNNFFLEVSTKVSVEKKHLRRREVEMDGNTSATKRKASEEASSLDKLSST